MQFNRDLSLVSVSQKSRINVFTRSYSINFNGWNLLEQNKLEISVFNKITCAAVLEHFLRGESKKITSEDWLKLCVQHFRRDVLSRLVSIDRMQADFPLFSGHVSSAVRDFKDKCHAICFLILLQTNPPVVFRAASTDDSSRNDQTNDQGQLFMFQKFELTMANSI